MPGVIMTGVATTFYVRPHPSEAGDTAHEVATHGEAVALARQLTSNAGGELQFVVIRNSAAGSKWVWPPR